MDWWLLFIHASWLHLASFVGKACSIFERFGHSESEEPNVAGLPGGTGGWVVTYQWIRLAVVRDEIV